MSDTVFTHDVFLSHHQADKLGGRRLAERRRTAGRPAYDVGSRIPDFGFPLAAALGSDWVTLELCTMLLRGPANAGRRFTPQLLQGVI